MFVGNDELADEKEVGGTIVDELDQLVFELHVNVLLALVRVVVELTVKLADVAEDDVVLKALLLDNEVEVEETPVPEVMLVLVVDSSVQASRKHVIGPVWEEKLAVVDGVVLLVSVDNEDDDSVDVVLKKVVGDTEVPVLSDKLDVVKVDGPVESVPLVSFEVSSHGSEALVL
ncbi:hypothetical protein N0V90_010284 [Kalmusia sp. IMI 367209]|nr:hypothetical protein N0V90_010284 [Kalmusia sp. IMI 367209]